MSLQSSTSSVYSTVANYGGKQVDIDQGVKQFIGSSPSQVYWIYKKNNRNDSSYNKIKSDIQIEPSDTINTNQFNPNNLFITPADNKKNVLIPQDLYVNGSIYNSSDIELKNNIKIITEEKTDLLFDLDPVTFSFKKFPTQTHYGFIAQEVEKIFPEIVQNDYLGYKTVSYIEMIPILLSKMKKMQTELDELNEKVFDLKNIIG